MKESVYAYLRTVPRGKVVTYGQIAAAVGRPRAARAVGKILHANPDPAHIPCYKAVNRLGALSISYAFGGADAQQKRLEQEGIEVKNGRVDLWKYQWQHSAA